MYLKGTKQHNLKYGICNKKLAIKNIILLYDTRCKKDMSCKLFFKWLELYQIHNTIKDKGIYMLEKLDGLQLASIFANNRLKKFYSC